MRRVPPLKCLAALAALLAGPAAGEFDYRLELALERSVLDGATLGDDPGADRLEADSIELELDLEYALGDDGFLFYTGAAFVESETLESAGSGIDEDGIEHRQAGAGLFFGGEVAGRLRVGRIEVGEDDAWWSWIDDEVDAVDLDLAWKDLEGRALLSEARWPRSTAESRVDPELDGVRYALLALDWEFAAGHEFGLDLLRQRDRSASAAVGEVVDAEREDEVDADIDWVGYRYRGWFEFADFADIEVELWRAELDGEERVFESAGIGGGRVEVEERIRRELSAAASAWRVGLRPAILSDWRLRLGAVKADGDASEDDGVNESWRQSGIHGDNEIYGALYQPAPSNLELAMLAVDWRASENLTVFLARYDYRKRRAAGEAPDSAIELDADGAGRSLGSELDLGLKAELGDGLDLQLTAARFDAGRAYGNPPSGDAGYVSLEVDWQF